MVVTTHERKYWTIAVDPGTLKTGVALFEGNKFVRAFTLKESPKCKDSGLRAFTLIQELEAEVWDDVKCENGTLRHVTLVYENPQMFRIKGGLLKIEPVVRMAGMLTFWALSRDMAVKPYSVSCIKTGITGRNSASKKWVEAAMRRLIPAVGFDRPDHEYDAVSVGVYHLDQMDPGCFGAPLPVTVF